MLTIEAMPRPKALSASEIEAKLPGIPGWSLVDGKLHRELRFADFVEAMGFMTRVALHAEKLDHHPEWRNVWATVEVELTTHDCSGLSRGDFLLAARMNELAAGRARG